MRGIVTVGGLEYARKLYEQKVKIKILNRRALDKENYNQQRKNYV